MFRAYKEKSRDNWGTDSPGDTLTAEQIQLGAVLRIADATEAMAKRHTELIGQRDSFERDANYWRAQAACAERRISSLKGVITKLQRKIQADHGEKEST